MPRPRIRACKRSKSNFVYINFREMMLGMNGKGLQIPKVRPLKPSDSDGPRVEMAITDGP